MQYAALEAARCYEREAIERIRWMSIRAADLEVRGPRRSSFGQSNLTQAMDTTLDDESAA